jgi:hypothetical protein
MSDDTPGEDGLEFAALVADLAMLDRKKRADVQKAQDNAQGVLAKALELQKAGAITAADVARLHAHALRLDLASKP